MKVELKQDGTILITAMTVAEGFALKGLANNKVVFDLSVLGCPRAEAVDDPITDAKTDLCFEMKDIIVKKWSNKMRSAYAQAEKGIEVIHMPTQIRATCDDFKGEHVNRHIALVRLDTLLRSKQHGT